MCYSSTTVRHRRFKCNFAFLRLLVLLLLLALLLLSLLPVAAAAVDSLVFEGLLAYSLGPSCAGAAKLANGDSFTDAAVVGVAL
jgi:hypothetical protein